METHIIGTIVALLLVACIMALVAEWMKIPYTAALVLVGLGIALTKIAPQFVISKEVIFTLVLPPLLFQGAMHVNLEDLRENWKTITFMAIPGVVVSTVLIGFSLHVLWNIDLLYGLLFGALITPTDPISVLSTLKKIGAPKRLRLILEGESLFNDGTGVVIFSAILAMIATGAAFDPGQMAIKFIIVTGGSVLVGGLAGYFVHRVLTRINNHLIEVAITVVLVFGVPLLAEAIHLSGIIAVVIAGLVIGNYGRYLSMSTKTRQTLETFWEVIDFLINSLLFLAIGMELQVIGFGDSHNVWLLVFTGILISFLARAAVVYPTTFALNNILKEKLPWSWTHVLFWGGLKGSIPIALVVGLDKGFPHRVLFLQAAFAIVLVSLIFQGVTMKGLLKRVGLLGPEG